MSVELDRLMRELRQAAGWEDGAGATRAARTAALLPGDEPVHAFVRLLRELDEVDLSEDAGDMSDELWRTRTALEAGLVDCGVRAIEPLRPFLAMTPPARASTSAMRVLARLGDARALEPAERWALDDDDERLAARLAALDAIGHLRPANAAAVLRAALTRPGTVNQSHVKRTAALALARVGDVEALEVLLDDDDWYARLGAVEALKTLPREIAARALARAREDSDERVREAAGTR